MKDSFDGDVILLCGRRYCRYSLGYEQWEGLG